MGQNTVAGMGGTAVVAIKMDKTVIIVSAVVGSLGLLSAILGFAAEGTKLTNCTSAVGLGVCAAVFLLIAQTAVSVVGACCGCFKSRGAIPSDTGRLVGVICAVSSWIAAVIASVMFLVGAIQASSCANYYLTGVSAGIFACAGLLSLLATGLGIASYVMLRRQPQPEKPAVPEQSPNYQPYDSPPLTQGDGGQALTDPVPQGGGHGQVPNPQCAVRPPAPARGNESQAPTA